MEAKSEKYTKLSKNLRKRKQVAEVRRNETKKKKEERVEKQYLYERKRIDENRKNQYVQRKRKLFEVMIDCACILLLFRCLLFYL